MSKVHPYPSPPSKLTPFDKTDPDPNQDAEKPQLMRMDTTMSVDTAILAQQAKAGTEDLCFITRLDSQGNTVKEVSEENTVPHNSSFFGRPLGSYTGSNKRFNLFRKKSGILGVIHAQTKKNRVVSKHGRLNTFRKTDEFKESHRFFKDFFTSMIDLTWTWTFFSFAASFFVSWLLFGVVWYIVAYVHGDFLPEDERPEDFQVCVDNLVDFTSCFLFSLETQHTIGYGGRATTERCPVAIIVMSLQSIFGVVIQACMAGILFAKFTKPINRGETIIFSKNAVITLRNGAFYLVVRIGDMRPTHLIECHVSGHIVLKNQTEEGEAIPYNLSRMSFGAEMDGSEEYFQMLWPLTLSHKIDSESPLYDMAPRDILSKQFEVIVTVEGTTPETGNSIQARTSYLPNEILWGHRFDHTCVAYNKDLEKYVVSYSTMNKCNADRTPRCSAKELDDRLSRQARLSTISDQSIPEVE